MHPRLAALFAVVTVLAACSGDDAASTPADDPAQFAAENLDGEIDPEIGTDDADPTTTVDDGPLDPASRSTSTTFPCATASIRSRIVATGFR